MVDCKRSNLIRIATTKVKEAMVLLTDASKTGKEILMLAKYILGAKLTL